jgi:hypothetical protein
MSEPIIERLSRFTPDAGGLDRDTLLFAAGRASARPNRAWIALAAVLVFSQALTLALWWMQPPAPMASLPPPATPPSAPLALPEPATPDSSDSPGLLSAHRLLLGSEPEDRPAPANGGNFVESGPPLRAFAVPPSSILY